ncbi:MAG: ABC transporter substrate-binding protein [Nitrospinota bacterium]
MTVKPDTGRRVSRREFLAELALATGGALFGPVVFSHAQGQVKPGQPLPPLLMESYSPPQYVQAVRIYIQELRKLGIRVKHRPMTFPALIGKVYRRHNYVTALAGFGSATERIDPDFYLRSMYHTDGGFNVAGYSVPEYDRVVEAQARELDPQKRKRLIEKAQRIFARDLPSWPVIGQASVHPHNVRLFTKYIFRKVTGLGLDGVETYLELQPTGDVKEVNVATILHMNSAHLFTERYSSGRDLLRLVYDTFFKYDRNFDLIPWAAESYKVTDGTTVELRIRDGMTWHDGKPVTAQDVKFTFDYLLKWRPVMWRFTLTPIKSVELVDSLTVRIRLHHPSAIFKTVSLAFITILPKHIWKDIPEKAGVKKPSDWNMAKHGAIGSGPFKLEAFEKDVDCHISANRDYWKGAPKIEGLHFVQAASIEQILGGMENQTLHITTQGLNVPEGRKLAERPYIDLYAKSGQVISYFFLNLREPLFQDPALRRAFYYATPKQKIVDVAWGGGGIPARRSPLPPVFTDWIPSDLPGDEYNIDRAKKVLADAGYSWKNGLLVTKGA